jgi:hypothetical protein
LRDEPELELREDPELRALGEELELRRVRLVVLAR